MSIQIIADSCCDVTPAMRALLQIKIAPLTINVGEQAFVDDENMDPAELLAAMKACKNPPSTACPSPDAYAALMRECDECFVITLSSPLSGSYNSAMVARDMVLEEMPEKKIHVFDSESAAAGETLIARMLRDRIDAGRTFEEIVEEMTPFVSGIRTFFVLESLENLVKNGRIGRLAGFVGTMLNLRPIMGEDGHGNIVQVEKVRGTAAAMKRLTELLAERTAELPAGSRTLVITYCNCADRIVQLKASIAAACPAFREIIILPTRGISTVYAYDGGLVLAY